MLNHAVAKSMLFLSSGAIKYSTGTDRFDELGGLMDGSRLLAACFLIGALSLIGIPPLLGFWKAAGFPERNQYFACTPCWNLG